MKAIVILTLYNTIITNVSILFMFMCTSHYTVLPSSRQLKTLISFAVGFMV